MSCMNPAAFGTCASVQSQMGPRWVPARVFGAHVSSDSVQRHYLNLGLVCHYFFNTDVYTFRDHCLYSLSLFNIFEQSSKSWPWISDERLRAPVWKAVVRRNDSLVVSHVVSALLGDPSCPDLGFTAILHILRAILIEKSCRLRLFHSSYGPVLGFCRCFDAYIVRRHHTASRVLVLLFHEDCGYGKSKRSPNQRRCRHLVGCKGL